MSLLFQRNLFIEFFYTLFIQMTETFTLKGTEKGNVRATV